MTTEHIRPFRHLLQLFDGVAVAEHCWYTIPRHDHGSCTDDMARVLVITARALSSGVEVPAIERLAVAALAYCRAASIDGFPVRTRMDVGRRWVVEPPSTDTDARVLWGLGVASSCRHQWLALPAGELFAELAPTFRANAPRSVAIAAIGASERLSTSIPPRDGEARCLLERLEPCLSRPNPNPNPWRWPEGRLSYANANLCEALIAAGATLGRPELTSDGLELLEWLVGVELRRGRFSFSPVGGRGPGESGPAFDQQPIEAASMVDACWRAHAVTGSTRWAEMATRGAEWFVGGNDTGHVLVDPRSRGCADGLHRDGVNANQGAESTIAAISTAQRVTSISGRPITSPIPGWEW